MPPLGRLSLFAGLGGRGKGEGGTSAGEAADSDELPAGDDQRGVCLVGYQFARMFGDLTLPVGAALAADSAQGGGVAAAFRSEVAAVPVVDAAASTGPWWCTDPGSRG